MLKGLEEILGKVLLNRTPRESSLWKSVWRFLKTLKIELPCDPAVPFLGIDAQSTPNPTVAVSTHLWVLLSYSQQQSNAISLAGCPSADEQILRTHKKMDRLGKLYIT